VSNLEKRQKGMRFEGFLKRKKEQAYLMWCKSTEFETVCQVSEDKFQLNTRHFLMLRNPTAGTDSLLDY